MTGVKHDGGKLRYDLIPARPLAELARVFTIGAEKYGDRNWEKGLQFGRVYAALMRHAYAWWTGERDDQEDGQHHLASVAWCALALIELEETHPELDDRLDTLSTAALVARQRTLKQEQRRIGSELFRRLAPKRAAA